MSVLVPLVSMTAIALMIVFWAWMFWDMTNNDDIPGNAKYTWMLGVVFLSIFVAIYYYVYVYRSRS